MYDENEHYYFDLRSYSVFRNLSHEAYLKSSRLKELVAFYWSFCHCLAKICGCFFHITMKITLCSQKTEQTSSFPWWQSHKVLLLLICLSSSYLSVLIILELTLNAIYLHILWPFSSVLQIFPKLASSWEFHGVLIKNTESCTQFQTYWLRIFI